MRLTLLNEKVIGKELAVPIYTENGLIYMNKGIIFTEKSINQINRLGITTVYIEDGVNDVTLQELFSAPAKLRAAKKLKSIFDNCIKHNYINENEIVEIVEDIIKNINISENALLFNNVANIDDKLKLCIHSINVTLLCIVIGYNKKYNKIKLLKLGIGALLHDIGKLFNETEEHTILGYKLVKKNVYFSLTSCACILSHHENENGTGYPNKLKGDKIYEFAKIVSICNEYVNISDSDDAILPHEAIEKISALTTKQKFSNELYQDFIKSIYCYPNGLKVKLNNGLDAMIIQQNKGMPSRPIVAYRKNGVPKLSSLVDDLTLFIEEVIS